jgi:Ca2+-binding RTX toxin-like protein
MRWDSLGITYSFPGQAAFYGPGYGLGEPQNNFEPLSAVQATVVRSIFRMISAVANLQFTEIEETASVHADLRFAMSDTPQPAWAYTIEDGAEGGDAWFGNSNGWYDQPIRGNQAFWAFLHEICHTLGLKHGHEEGGFGAMTAASDSMANSVTTYRSYIGSAGQVVENETWGYAQTLMMDDIAALQHMYGANFETQNGNTVYRWSPTTGEAFVNGEGQGPPGQNRVFMTIWDGGGLDTYDFGNYRTNLAIDLRPGGWSKTSGNQIAYLGGFLNFADGNIANALLYQGDLRSLIENAVGGSGNDSMVGNLADNTFRGGKGADRLNGMQGKDVLVGGPGKDILRGGDGTDMFVFDTRPNNSSNVDKIMDFRVTDDSVYLENAVFKALGKGSSAKPHKLPKGYLTIGDKAKDANDYVVYDPKKGVLFYDADGSGAGEAVRIATLSKSLKISVADLFVI